MRFSERIGKKTPKSEIQLDSMDQDLKNGLWNTVDMFICKSLQDAPSSYLSSSKWFQFFYSLWFSHFKERTDNMPDFIPDLIDNLRRRFYTWDYLDTYDFIDFTIGDENIPYDFRKDEFIDFINIILKKELSGYRVINGQLAPITRDNEILEIEKAISQTASGKFKGVHIHLTDALSKIADRKNPDYRNSIKESICAIESLCQVIANDPKAELGKALKVIKSKISIHGALEQGFLKIYGYTSDGDGIRHALLDEPNLDQEDALFMLITCSAFVNYLIIKAHKMGIDK